MSAVVSPKIAESLARCSTCGQIKLIVSIDRACNLVACRVCAPCLDRAHLLIELANRHHNARLSHPNPHLS